MSKIRKSAKGQECTLQIYPYCNQNTETVVLCHIGSEGKGMGIKSPDFFGVYGCSNCHDIIDKRRRVDLPEVEILNCILRGLFRTWRVMIEAGVIKI